MTEENEPEVSDKPRRGRPPRQHEELGERKRRRKTGAISGIKLSVDESKLDRRNFEYRFINDRPGRIHQLTQNDDWDLVTGEDGATGVNYHAGLSDEHKSMRTYLARKPKQWYEDDQAEKQREIDRLVETINRGTLRNNSPEAAAIAGAHGYVPEGAISIRDGRRK